MPLFSPPIISYMSGQSLAVLLPSQEESLNLTFSPAAMRFGEIIDPHAFQSELSSFFATANIQGKRVVIFLSPELVFSGSLASNAKSSEELRAAVKNFLDTVPVDTHQQLVLDVKAKDTLQIFVAGKKYLEAIGEQWQHAGIKVSAIVPISVMLTGTETAITPEMLRAFEQQDAQVSRYNLLHAEPKLDFYVEEEGDAPVSTNQATPTSSRVALLLACLVTFLLTVGYLWWSGRLHNSLNGSQRTQQTLVATLYGKQSH